MKMLSKLRYEREGAVMGFSAAIRSGAPGAKKRMKIYTLYATGGAGDVFNQSKYYQSFTHWIARVRATSIRQAYALVYAHQEAAGKGAAGIVQLDNSEGPGAGWPWRCSTRVAPGHWRHRYADAGEAAKGAAF